MTLDSHERRKYYRIDDDVLLHYNVLEQSESGATQAEHVELSAESVLAELDQELNHAINLVWRDLPEVGRALGLLNRKIAIMGALAGATGAEEDPQSYTPTRVNLSGSGLAFEALEAIPEGTALLIRIRLLPSQSSLRLTGCVVGDPERVAGTDTARYWTRIRFDGNADAQEELIRHVVQKQGALLSARH